MPLTRSAPDTRVATANVIAVAESPSRLIATLLTDSDAVLLGVERKSPVLYIQRLAYLADGRCVEFTRSYYRADTYDFVSELTLAPATRKNRN